VLREDHLGHVGHAGLDLLLWVYHQKYRIIALTFEPKILTKANHKTPSKSLLSHLIIS
jgi:hypothetical protein